MQMPGKSCESLILKGGWRRQKKIGKNRIFFFASLQLTTKYSDPYDWLHSLVVLLQQIRLSQCYKANVSIVGDKRRQGRIGFSFLNSRWQQKKYSGPYGLVDLLKSSRLSQCYKANVSQTELVVETKEEMEQQDFLSLGSVSC